MSAESESSKKKSVADELKARPRKMNGKSRKIGVMNPYVLVRMLGKKGESSPELHKIDLNDPETLRLMNAHFKKHKLVKKHWTYRSLRKNLYDPKLSPLYKPMIKVGSGVANPDVISAPAQYKPLGTLYVKEPRGGKSEIFGDVIQGAAINCYFHAALYSMAWVNWNAFPWAKDKIAFNGQTIAVNPTFLVDANNKPVGAQISPKGEFWACAWEKAYGEFKHLKIWGSKNGTPGTSPYDPDVLTFGEGDPLQSLSEITNLAYDFTDKTFGYPTAYDTSAEYCYTTLNIHNVGASDGTSMITANPTVAWTKETCDPYGRSGAIIPSHAYSILGTFTPDSGKTMYIVLRNPWGKTFDTTGSGMFAQIGDYFPPGLDSPITLGPKADKGIFGLRNGVFWNYFAGFGWVKKP